MFRGGAKMISYIEEYEPPKRRLRTKHKLRLTVFLLLIVCTLLAILIPKKGTSQVEFVPYTVRYGDTYWQIAKQLQHNGYRSKDDIRNIVDELIRKSGIKAHELKDGDIIYIPELGE